MAVCGIVIDLVPASARSLEAGNGAGDDEYLLDKRKRVSCNALHRLKNGTKVNCQAILPSLYSRLASRAGIAVKREQHPSGHFPLHTR